MHIYFAGIGGVGLGPLALFAHDAGHKVSGSDLNVSRYTDIISAAGIQVNIGQSGEEIAITHSRDPIDWIVYSAALPPSHPEVRFAKEMRIKFTKRADFINRMLKDKNLKMLAVAGTHGKTNTTSMLVWTFKQLKLPVSYAVGTNLSFGPSGKYEKDSEYFLYEADEFDRNFLEFKPLSSIITALDFDHPDTYKDTDAYQKAFREFATNSQSCFTWSSIAQGAALPKNVTTIPDEDEIKLELVGKHTRRNATLAINMLEKTLKTSQKKLVDAINKFPGSERRLESLSKNLITDYAHHPVEIKAAIQAASEINKDLVVVYQPHQNIRQHEIIDEYQNCFAGAKHVYWLPTYLSREDDKDILKPSELIKKLADPKIAEPSKMDDKLEKKIAKHIKDKQLVLVMGAGSVDDWIRNVDLSSSGK